MGDLLIRGVDESVLSRLKSKAVANKTSVQAEARQALARGAPITPDERRRLFQEFAESSEGLPKTSVSGGELVREMRDKAE